MTMMFINGEGNWLKDAIKTYKYKMLSTTNKQPVEASKKIQKKLDITILLIKLWVQKNPVVL